MTTAEASKLGFGCQYLQDCILNKLCIYALTRRPEHNKTATAIAETESLLMYSGYVHLGSLCHVADDAVCGFIIHCDGQCVTHVLAQGSCFGLHATSVAQQPAAVSSRAF